MYHKVILAGHLGRDPELRYTQDGDPVTNFSVATSRKWTGRDGEKHEETIWWRVSVWGKQAETTNQYLAKGSAVLIEGAIVPSDKGGPKIWYSQDGEPRASFEVRAQSVRFLGRGSSHGNGESSTAAPVAPTAPAPVDEVPF